MDEDIGLEIYRKLGALLLNWGIKNEKISSVGHNSFPIFFY
jgi:hypothetical protein